jgi:hypothetical protein
MTTTKQKSKYNKLPIKLFQNEFNTFIKPIFLGVSVVENRKSLTTKFLTTFCMFYIPACSGISCKHPETKFTGPIFTNITTAGAKTGVIRGYLNLSWQYWTSWGN